MARALAEAQRAQLTALPLEDKRRSSVRRRNRRIFQKRVSGAPVFMHNAPRIFAMPR